MPTVAELERLQALVRRLAAVGDKQRGELIEAADWNGLVGAVIEVARAVLGDERGEVVPDHHHDDQVTTGWLDPRLRTLVLGGPLSDPAAEARLTALDRRVGRLSERFDEVAGGVERVRVDVGEVATRDLAREADLTRFGRKVDGLGDARSDVADLRGTLRALEVDVSRAVEVGRQLEVDGQPLDVSSLVARVSAVEELRTRLTTSGGSLLDAASLERQMTELRTSLVTEAELTEALTTVRGGVSEEDRAALLETARTTAVQVATESARTVADALRAEIPERLAAVDGKVAAAVASATQTLADDLLGQARQEIAAAVSSGDQSVREELAASFDTRFGQLQSTFEDRVSNLSARVDERVASAIAEQLPAALSPVESRVAGLGDRVGVVETAAAAADARATAVATRVEEVRREAAADRARLATEQGSRIDGLESGLGGRIAGAVDGLRAGLAADLRTDLDATRRDLEAALTQAAQKAATAEVQVLATQLRGEVREVVVDEVKAVRTELNEAIDARVAVNENRIGGLVADEVRRATSGLQQLVRQELEAVRPELMRDVEARVDKRINETQVRPDTAQPGRPDRLDTAQPAQPVGPGDTTTIRPERPVDAGIAQPVRPERTGIVRPEDPGSIRGVEPGTVPPADQPPTGEPPAREPVPPGGEPIQPIDEAPAGEPPAGEPVPPGGEPIQPTEAPRPAKRAAKRRPPRPEPPPGGTT